MSTQLHDVLQPANIVPHSRRACGHSYVVPYNAPQLLVCTWSNYPTLISTSSMSDLSSEISVLCPTDQLIKVHTRRQQSCLCRLPLQLRQEADILLERKIHAHKFIIICLTVHRGRPVLHTKTSPLPVRCCPLIFSFQKNEQRKTNRTSKW